MGKTVSSGDGLSGRHKQRRIVGLAFAAAVASATVADIAHAQNLLADPGFDTAPNDPLDPTSGPWVYSANAVSAMDPSLNRIAAIFNNSPDPAAPESGSILQSITLLRSGRYRLGVSFAAGGLSSYVGSIGGTTVFSGATTTSIVPSGTIVLTAGATTVQFSATPPAAFQPFVPNYVILDDAYLVYMGLAIPGAATMPGNAGTVGRLIDGVSANGGLIPPGFDALGSLTGSRLTAALSQLTGEANASGPVQTSLQTTNMFFNVLLDPSINARGSPTDGDADGFAAAEALPYTRKRDEKASAAYAAVTPRDARSTFQQRWSVWASGYGGSSTVSGNADAGSQSTTSRIYGTAAGVDYRLSRDTLVGFALGGAGANFSTQGLGGGRADAFQAGAFVRHTTGPAYVLAALAYGWQGTTTERTVTVAGTDTLQAKFNAHTFSGRGEAGYRFALPAAGLTPYAALQITSVRVPGYAETATSGSNQFALTFPSSTTTNLRSELGLRADRTLFVGDSILAVQGRAAFAHDSDTARIVSPTFQSLPGSAAFSINGAQPSPDSALVSAGAQLKWRNGWSLAGSFEGEFSRTTASNAGKGTVRYIW